MAELAKQKSRTAALFVLVPIFMLCLGFAAKPLYDTFCRITGFGGTTRIAEEAPSAVLDRVVDVRFDANTANAPLLFRPIENSHPIHLGEHGLAFYEATNVSDQPVSVIASYNVTPHKAGPFFNKLECFCFEERLFLPGETKKLPVVFFIAPELDEKRLLDDVRTITLSYTFFPITEWQGASNSVSLD
ncbi:MAG: cytochrome c oxidase assembly protein [Pseudomonadota bacterium]